MSQTGGSRTIIVQHAHGGHRLVYVRHLLQSPLVGPRPRVLLTSEAVDSWEFRHHLQDAVLESAAELYVAAEGIVAEDMLRAALKMAVTEGGRLVVPDADRLLSALLRADRPTRRQVELRYLVMRTPMGSMRDRLISASKYGLAASLRLLWRKPQGFFLSDAFCVVKRPALSGLLKALPDPSPALPSTARGTARRRLGLPSDGFLLGILGTVTERKNPHVAIEAVERLLVDQKLLLAGEMSAGVRRRVAALAPAARERVLVLDRQLSDEELGCAVSACDAVLLLHDLDGPSGMLLNAAAAGVPVVVGESPWLRRVVRRAHLGVVATHRAESVAAAVQHLSLNPLVVRAPPIASEEHFAEEFLGTS